MPRAVLFTTPAFFAFVLVTWCLHWAVSGRPRLRRGVLFVASLAFYASWDWRFLGLLLGSAVVDFHCGKALDRPGLASRTRRAILGLSVFVNLGVLATFKYADFFLESAQRALGGLGLETSSATLGLILPIGISFYTFQTLSYTIDRYRGRVEVTHDFIEFGVFVAFFPQLIAGPIVRAGEMLRQLRRPRRFDWADQALGIRLILWGLFQKCVVADNLSPFVDAVFSDPAQALPVLRVAAVVAFAFQIYADFSGYSDMARGIAQTFGIHLPRNFRIPYLARGPSEFWQRWHVTLSTWLRDYLYIPLGGNRRGAWRTRVNLMLTMVLGGLWHGAGWTFVLWGAYQGALLIAYRDLGGDAWTGLRSGVERWGATILFFALTCVGWWLFRANSMTELMAFLEPSSALASRSWPLTESMASGLAVAGVAIVVLMWWDFVLERKGGVTALEHLSVPRAALSCLALYLSVSWFGRFERDAFLYFQF